MKMNEGKRWSGADWATEQRLITLVGLGGIGSWTALNLSRIGHELYLVDGDTVDETNVRGGQMYKMSDIGKTKALAVHEICREMGCVNCLDVIEENYNEETHGMTDICICGLDNMAARKEVFIAWEKHLNHLASEGGGMEDCLFIDGRLLLENMEIFTIKGDDEEAITKYKAEHLFDDSEVTDLDCTTKQCTFSAMIIAGMITSALCNFLTNRKIGTEFREVPFLQKLYLPLFRYKTVPCLEKA